MRYSRSSLIALLVAVEIVVAGAALSVLRGPVANAGGLHRLVAVPEVFPSIDAGTTPNVTVSVPDSRIIVEPSTDGQVHVTDQTSSWGNVFGTVPKIPSLQVTRTAGGVHVERPYSSHLSFFVLFGWLDQRVKIELPPGASLEIARCAGADISGLSGPVTARSDDGSIHLSNLTGDNIDVFSADGRIRAAGIRSGRLAMASRDGSLRLDNVAVEQLVATTNDGSIRAHGLQIAGAHPSAQVHSDDGSVQLHFADAGNVKVQAQTSDGRIVVDGRSTSSDDDAAAPGSYTLGNGTGTLDVSTQDGTIAMTTNGAQ